MVDDDKPTTEPALYSLLRSAAKLGASDLHIKADAPPHVRSHGDLSNLGTPPLSGAAIDKIVFEAISADQADTFRRVGSLDFAVELAGSDRFRINLFRQRGRTSLACRRVTRNIPTFAQLHLPKIAEELSELRQGLVLVTGITGAGKSTTIAAMIEHINQTRPCHIVTIEDPIEYLYEDKQALVNQREIGIDVADFAAALKYLMREDPDVVLIGEMRDTETFEAALHAAETGHLVFGTVHAASTISTITRLLDLFPEGSRALVRQSLVFNLRAVIAQKLLPSIAPGISRIPAVEVLIVNPAARKMIADGREADLVEIIAANPQAGMVDFNGSLERLVENEMISLNEAMACSPNPNELRMRLKGIRRGGG